MITFLKISFLLDLRSYFLKNILYSIHSKNDTHQNVFAECAMSDGRLAHCSTVRLLACVLENKDHSSEGVAQMEAFVIFFLFQMSFQSLFFF